MDIYIKTENLINDVSSKFLQELGSADPIPPRGTLIQCLNEASAKLLLVCGRYMGTTTDTSVDDDLTSAQQFHYELLLSSRKASNKAQALADTMHSFLVNAALGKAYATMNSLDLTKKHDDQTISDTQVLIQLLSSKIPPQL